MVISTLVRPANVFFFGVRHENYQIDSSIGVHRYIANRGGLLDIVTATTS